MNENNAWTSPDGRSPSPESTAGNQPQAEAREGDPSVTPDAGQSGFSAEPRESVAGNSGAPSSEGAPDSGQPGFVGSSPTGGEALGEASANASGETNVTSQINPYQSNPNPVSQSYASAEGQNNPTGQTGANPTGANQTDQANPTGQTGANPSAQYGANQFWGQSGFSDPLAGTRPLETSVTWAQPAEKAKRRGPGWLGTIGIAVAASLVTGGGFYVVSESLPGKAESASSTLFNPEDKGVTTPAPVSNSTSQNPDWEAVAKAVRPAVVAIIVSTGSGGGDQGSGSIIDSDGHILTNNHVVASAAGGNGQITVELHDGRLYEAEIVGRDVLTDLAVIKIKNPPKDLTVVALGDSSKLQVGESVAAIGNPLGLSSTVTTGIVSALDRPVRVDVVQGGGQSDRSDQLFDLRDLFGGNLGGNGGNSRGGTTPVVNDKVTTNAIQVDAAVNPGNSGGPLFDSKGRVIGVTSSIASISSGSTLGGGQAGSIGLGFAIPINQAQMIATQLIEHGEAVHAALGITVSEDIATVKEVSRLGAKVQEMSSGGAAEKAGMKVGDIIVGINGKLVKGSESLVGWVRQHAVGDTVELEIVRDGKEMKVSVTLQAQ